jgi:hypothetical protein
MASAAMWLSRIATMARPTRPRSRFQARTKRTTAMVNVKK